MRVKVCGVRTVAEVDAAVQAGATAIGFVFHTSPRQVGPAEARALVDRVPRGVEAVAVFKKAEPELLARVLDLGVDGVQAEDEPAGLARAGVFFLRSVQDGPDLLSRLGEPAKGTLVSGSLRGCVLIGGVVAGDRDRVRAACELHPVVIGGGLTAETVGSWVADVRPIGVDVSAGVEAAARKDAARMRAFVQAVRGIV